MMPPQFFSVGQIRERIWSLLPHLTTQHVKVSALEEQGREKRFFCSMSTLVHTKLIKPLN